MPLQDSGLVAILDKAVVATCTAAERANTVEKPYRRIKVQMLI